MSWRTRLRQWLGVPSVRAIRGAITVDRDEPGMLREAVHELLGEMEAANALSGEEVISAFFTVTPDLKSSFPATAAREAGWTSVPLLCASEIAVPDALPKCLRVLLHVQRCWNGAEVRHVYLRGAVGLRPDLETPAGAGNRYVVGVPQRELTMLRTRRTTPAASGM